MGAGLKSFITSFLLHFYGPAGYVGVFTLLVACGLGMPLPEDIALITGGFLAAMGPPHGVGSVWAMMLVGLLGILVGDSIIFKAGKDYGDSLLDTRLGKHIPKERIERTRELFVKHGSKLIMVARFLPGLRAVTYFVAGTSRMRYLVFVLYDGLAALISAPAWVWLGYWMGRKHAIRRAYAMAKQFQMAILAVMVLAALAGLLYWLVTQRRVKEAAARAALADIGPHGRNPTSLTSGEKRTSIPLTPPPRPGVERA